MNKKLQSGTAYTLAFREDSWSEAHENLKWQSVAERHNCNFVRKIRETVDGIVWSRAIVA